MTASEKRQGSYPVLFLVAYCPNEKPARGMAGVENAVASGGIVEDLWWKRIGGDVFPNMEHVETVVLMSRVK